MQLEHSYTAMQNVKQHNHFRELSVFKRVKHKSTGLPRHSTPNNLPKTNENIYLHKDVYANISIFTHKSSQTGNNLNLHRYMNAQPKYDTCIQWKTTWQCKEQTTK